MSIFPLPVFETEADPRHRSAMSDEEIYARLEPPKTIVVKFGAMKLVGEFSYDGDAKPGCGSKLVARTIRGTELVEMLTTTCSNSGCGKSISRQEMLEYIENSGGRDFPFHTKGRILRVATIEDLNKQSAITSQKTDFLKFARAQVYELKLPMKMVDVEPILGGELMTFFYMSEDRIDFRDLVNRLSAEYKTRIEMRQVGARDEARLVADYERCGQHCCCKNFLKVLKPISMRSAKVQKATLDPLKISGRCGRLMCCLRYEDQTYTELKKNLPHRNTRVGTSEGPGVVIDGKILVQLVLVRLEHDMREIAVPVEELMDPENCPKPKDVSKYGEAIEYKPDPLRGMPAEKVKRRLEHPRPSRAPQPEPPVVDDAGDEVVAGDDQSIEGSQALPQNSAPMSQQTPQQGQHGQQESRGGRRRKRRRDRKRSKDQQQDAFRAQSQALEGQREDAGDGPEDAGDSGIDAEGDGGVPIESSSSSGGGDPSARGQQNQQGGQGGGHRKRRRRRRRRRGGGGAGGQGGGAPGGGGDAGGGGPPQ